MFEHLRNVAPLVLLLVLCTILAAVAPGFASHNTLSVILADMSSLFVLAAGVTFVILLGGIDLSIQAVASLGSVVLAQTLPRAGPAAFLLVLVTGLLVGLLSGIVHVRLRVPSFVATLATAGVASGISLLLANGRTITIGAEQRRFTGWLNGMALGVPSVFLLAAAIGLIGFVVLRYTRFGRSSLAVGAGEPAALAAGINVDRVKITAFAISGMLAAVAGAILSCRMSSGSPSLASQQLLPAIAAVIVGGTAITGGLGGMGRTAMGALIISITQLGMTFVGVNIFAQQTVFGLMLVAAVAVTIDRSKLAVIK
jgi:ribose transport system permease protein